MDIMIAAFNHLNYSVSAYSDAVIYDNTPPSRGRIEVEDGMRGFVTGDRFSIDWSGIDDEESGIRKIEIGIGSTNNSADIIRFKEFEDYAEIKRSGMFRDGHKYYAILKVKSTRFSVFVLFPNTDTTL